MPAHRSRTTSAHRGVSIKPLTDGRYRLRWRETLQNGNRTAQSWTVHAVDSAEAEGWALRVYRALQTDGTFVRPDDEARAPEQPRRPEVADWRDITTAWAGWRISHHGDREGTVKQRARGILKLEKLIREVNDLDDEGPIPVALAATTSTAEHVAQLIDKPHTRAKVLGVMWGAWTWASDEPERWPGLPLAPRDRTRVVSKLPPPPAPLDAPMWSEVETILRIAHGSEQSRAATTYAVAAYTGLRVGQVLRLRVGDVDLKTRSLTVRGDLGKSRQERAGRVVPVSPALVPLLDRVTAGRPADKRIIGVVHDYQTHYSVMEAAEKQGVRPTIWRSAERGNKRPTHWARAAMQAYLRTERVPDNVIDKLVGHAGRTTRDRAYAPATWGAMVEAVALLPDLPADLLGGGEVVRQPA